MPHRTPIAIALLATLALGAAKPEPASAPTLKAAMHDKLDAAHGLLDALAVADFARLEHHAETLRGVSLATAALRPGSAEYQRHAASFQASADFLARQARLRNLEGVAMGYIRVTMDCMQCHQAIRDIGAVQ